MINRQNYIIIQEFLKIEKYVKNLSDGTIKVYRSRLNHILNWLDALPLESCLENNTSIYSYLDQVTVGANANGVGEPLSLESQKKIINLFKRLLRWCKKKYPKRFSKLDSQTIDNFKPPRISENSVPLQPFITIEEIKTIAEADLKNDLVLWATQSAACLLFLGAQRRTAFVTTSIRAVDLENLLIHQTKEMGVMTKNKISKTTSLLNIEGVIDRAREWDEYVRSQLPPHAMWYPPICNTFGTKTLTADPPGKHRGIGLAKNLRKLSYKLDIEYKPPHAYRRGHTIYAYQLAENMSDIKAISENLLHSNILTTDKIYSRLTSDDIHSKIVNLTQGTPNPPISQNGDIEKMIKQLLLALQNQISNPEVNLSL